MLRTVRHLLELIRFSHTLFALPFALLAGVMAWHLTTFRWQQLVGILFCMAFARSAAMAFNRIADRNIDAQNPRTKVRHIPAGILSVGQVTFFAVACSEAFVASTLWFVPNRLPLYLSVPVLLFLLGYSYAKRFTALAHIWLGTALALSPLAVWIALRGESMIVDPLEFLPPIVLGGAVMSWVTGFDIIYACQDFEFDLQTGLHSIPVALGIRGALRLAAVCHIITIACLAALPLVYPFFGWIYWAGVAAIALLLIYEHALVRPDDLSRVNAAFFNVNAIISLGLFAVGTLDLLVHRVGY